MIELFFLLIIIVIILGVSYIVNERDIMAPAILYLGGFCLAIIAAMMNIDEWGILLQGKTMAIIIVGILSFTLSDLAYHCIHKKNYRSTTDKLKVLKIETYKTVIVILIDVIAVVLYFREAVRLSAFADSYWQQFGVMTAYKHALTSSGESLSFFVNQLTKIVYVFGYIYSFVFFNNWFATKEKHRMRKNVLYLIPVLFYAVMSITKGNRIDIIGLVVCTVFLYYMFYHKKIGWNKHISSKFLRKCIVVFVVGIIAFYYLKDLVGRVSDLNLLEYVTQYIGGSIQLLDQYVSDPPTEKVFMGEVLTGLINGLRKIGLTSASIGKGLEYRYTPTGIFLGNVYTALRRYYNDAGWIGLLIFPSFLCAVMNKLYAKVRKQSGYSTKGIFTILVYASLLYVVPIQAMEDTFYINKVSIGYIIELVILYIGVCFIFDLKVKTNKMVGHGC